MSAKRDQVQSLDENMKLESKTFYSLNISDIYRADCKVYVRDYSSKLRNVKPYDLTPLLTLFKDKGAINGIFRKWDFENIECPLNIVLTNGNTVNFSDVDYDLVTGKEICSFELIETIVNEVILKEFPTSDIRDMDQIQYNFNRIKTAIEDILKAMFSFSVKTFKHDEGDLIKTSNFGDLIDRKFWYLFLDFTEDIKRIEAGSIDFEDIKISHYRSLVEAIQLAHWTTSKIAHVRKDIKQVLRMMDHKVSRALDGLLDDFFEDGSKDVREMSLFLGLIVESILIAISV